MRPNRTAPTGREQKRYGRSYSRVFGKKKASGSKSSETKRRSKRETAYRRHVKAGLGKEAAAKRAMKEVPFLKSQKGRTFRGQKAYTGKAVKARLPKQYKTKTVKVKKKVTRRVPKKRRVRVAYGRYKRIRATDPKTGKKRLSYLYRTKSGKRRKIPSYAIAGAKSPKQYRERRFRKKRARIEKRRETAAKRIRGRGGAFTPNRRSKSMRPNKSTKRSRAAKKAWRTRRRRAAARSAAARKGSRRRTRRTARRRPAKRRRVRRNAGAVARRARPTRRRRATTVRRNRRRRTAATPNRRRRVRRNKATVRRTRRRATPNKSAKRAAAARKGWRTRRARSRARVGRGRGRRGVYLKRGKVYYRGRKPRRLRGVKARKLPKARVYVTNRRRKARKNKRRSYRRNRRGSYRRNQFMSRLRSTLGSAAFVTTGFIGHKLLTYITCDRFLLPMLSRQTAPTNNSTAGLGQLGGAGMQTGLKILCGGVAAVGGVLIASRVASKQRAAEIGAGMLASWLHTTIVSVLDMGAQTRAFVPYIAGYDTASTAAAIGRYRRRGMRGMRGLGQAGPASSILPRYSPTGMPGGIQQAVALAGRRGAGEYFATSGVGEYFATGVQGVGQYEPAGPMVTQAAAGLGQQIDNGILPSQAEDALTLAEAQAGTGASMMGMRGMRGLGRLGEYYSARPENGDWREYRVPTKSTWVPGGPLWAGTKPAEDSLQTSEVPAGILESASGNGIF